ncbi:MAG: isochorismatase family protein [Emcibacter sp.]|nr:isochorismatase family protein [Emcibacter sp.]
MAHKKVFIKNDGAAQFGKTLEPGKRPALLLVDFVMAYIDHDSPLYAGVENVFESAGRILEVARKSQIPVIFTNVVYSKDGRDGGVFYRKIGALESFLKGNPLAEFSSSLMPMDGDLVLSKQYASAFFGTSLSSTLTAMKVDTVIVTGLSTSGCVRATAVDACQHGFIPLVVKEAVGDRDSIPHEANLFDLQAKYAEVVSEGFILSYLDNIS